MSTQTDKIRQAIERAMARIGCPPGDNADADLYRELRSTLSGLEARPSPTREQIADRIREEYRKHPALDWADIAAAKILSSMREEAQPTQTEDLIPVRQAVRIVQQWIIDRDLAMNQGRNTFDMLKARMDGYLRSIREEAIDAAFARSIAPPSAPTVDQMAKWALEWFEGPIDNGPGSDLDKLKAYMKKRMNP